jgi:hypothetical protein
LLPFPLRARVSAIASCFEEGKMEKVAIPDPSTVSEMSTVTEEQI